jgi:hypothetical protein
MRADVNIRSQKFASLAKRERGKSQPSQTTHHREMMIQPRRPRNTQIPSTGYRLLATGYFFLLP